VDITESAKDNKMALRFRKSMKIMPGVRLSLSKGGVSTSFGTTGARMTLGSDGKVRGTVGIPGSGLSNTEVLSSNKRKNKKSNNDVETVEKTEKVIMTETGAELPSLDNMPNYNLIGGVVLPYFIFYFIVGSWAGYLVGGFTMLYWLYIKFIRLAVMFPSLFGVKTKVVTE
jgi:hypothetical protein